MAWSQKEQSDFSAAIRTAKTTTDMDHPCWDVIRRSFQEKLWERISPFEFGDVIDEDAVSEAHLKIFKCVREKIDPNLHPYKIYAYLLRAGCNVFLDVERNRLLKSRLDTVNVDDDHHGLAAPEIETPAEAVSTTASEGILMWYQSYILKRKTVCGVIDARARYHYQRAGRVGKIRDFVGEAQAELLAAMREN